jgi:hypothetical protein
MGQFLEGCLLVAVRKISQKTVAHGLCGQTANLKTGHWPYSDPHYLFTANVNTIGTANKSRKHDMMM